MIWARFGPRVRWHDGRVDETPEIGFSQEFWDDRYRTADQLFSGQPNSQLVAQVAGLRPGLALDAGAGEGADAVWLARQGWAVTAVDVSGVALQRAAGLAAAAGEPIAARIRWQREDLRSWIPERERFDLVTALFMYLPPDEQAVLHQRLADAVCPGGMLLVVGHHRDDWHANVGRHGPVEMLWTAEDLAGSLEPAKWEIVLATSIPRPATDTDGHPAHVQDTVLRARRRG
jgi:SAM-dependent methyltransferase